jgi:hypothetical protein
MTEKENRVAQSEAAVRTAQVKVRETKSALEHGYAKAKADFEREYERLKCDAERATIELDREQAWLETAKAELARGYSTE